MLGLGRRGILDQFEQFIAPDDLARRGGDVLADDELAIVGLTDAQRSPATFQIGGEVLHALDQ